MSEQDLRGLDFRRMGRRAFLTGVGAVGFGGLLAGLPEGLSAGDDKKGGKGPAAGSRPANGLIFERVFTDGLAHLSYLIGDRNTGRAAVIDPRRDVSVYLDLARRHHLTITHAIETHIHADFVSGSRELADRTGTARVYVSAEGNARYGFPHQPLHNGDRIDLGRVILTARHTPGHTPEHMAYLAAENTHPDHPWGVFSGDCLFANSVGRPDLLGEDQTQPLARQLFRSLREVFLRLADDIQVFPAHGAGSPCGANIGDRLSTTIGYERRFNPPLQFADEARFIDYVLSTAPPEPRYYPRMKRLNTQGPEILHRLPNVPPLTARAFRAAIGRPGVQLVDNRQMLAFGGGHIAGALNIGPRAELSIWAGWTLDPEQPILLVLPDDARLPEVVRQLIRVGFTRFGGYLSGGMEAWDNAGLPLQRVPQMTVQDLRQPQRDLHIVDVRTPGEWDGGHVPGARYAFLPQVRQRLADLGHDRPVAVYCDSGYRASLAASLLQRDGFTDVRNVPGSWRAWTAAGFPVERPRQRGRGSDTNRS